VRRLGLWLALLAGASGCDPRLYDKGRPQVRDDRTPVATDAATEEAPAPRPTLSPFAALGALQAASQPGPFDEPLKSEQAKSGVPGAAVLELRGRVVELDAPFSFSLSMFSGGDSVALRRVTERLGKLDRSAEVSAVLLRLGDLSLSLAAAEELRAALAGVKKPVHCHAETLDDTGMLLASVCKTVALAPAGMVAIPGPSLLPLYLKGLLDKVGIQADFLHIGAYKGAAEPLTRREPSKEMRETYDELVDGAYQRLIEHVSAGRKAPREKVVAWIDQALFTAEEAKAAGLVDAVATFHEFRDSLSPGNVWRRERWKESSGGMDDLMGMLGMRPKKRVRGEHLALLYAVGEVVHGSGSPASAFEEISSGKLVPAIRAAGADDDVKAIVLRVDSPGGSALASELIYRAVVDAAARKPVIVSMGSVAASGGYYISAGAGKIYAQPDTLTGSIGVVGGKMVLAGGMAKLGIDVVEIARGKRALLGSPVRPWSEDERVAVRRTMEDVYETFKARVAEGRKLDPATVEKNAQGRVFTGAEAKARGLVDELGSLEDALAFARSAAKLPAEAPIDVYPGEPTLLDLLGGMVGAHAGVEAMFDGPLATAGALLGPRVAAEARALLRLALSFDGGEAVRLVVFTPAIR